MKTMKLYKIMVVALMLFAASLAIMNGKAEAKAYKMKTIKIPFDKQKTVKTKKKIKKITSIGHSTNQFFEDCWIKSAKKFTVNAPDHGKTKIVKVKYTNGYTQKYKIEVALPYYAKKVVNELESLLADPDEGVKKVLMDRKTYWETEAGSEHTILIDTYTKDNGHTRKKNKYYDESMTLDDFLKNYTKSQKKAIILRMYFTQRMNYGKWCQYRLHRSNINKFCKQLYQGKFVGVCEDGASIVYDICGFLGIKSYYIVSKAESHAWTVIHATDKNGTPYWAGINATSYAYDLKASLPAKYNYGTTTWYNDKNPPAELTKKTLKKYKCAPRPQISVEFKSYELGVGHIMFL